jgi:sulfur carrier protein
MCLERVKGIEPSYAAWEAAVLPLNYTRGFSASVSLLLMIQVIVNGAAQRFEQPLDVAALIARMQLAGRRIAVEKNGEIVPKSAHASTLVADGDRLEIVVAVGGG